MKRFALVLILMASSLCRAEEYKDGVLQEVTQSITNGLAGSSITNGFVTQTITNGLAGESITNDFATQTFVTNEVIASESHDFSVSMITDQVITNDIFTKVRFDNELRDQFNIYSDGDFRLTKIGPWSMVFHVQLEAIAKNKQVQLQSRTNDEAFLIIDEGITPGNVTTNYSMGSMIIFDVVDTNIVFSVYIKHDDSGALNLSGDTGKILTRGSGFSIHH